MLLEKFFPEKMISEGISISLLISQRKVEYTDHVLSTDHAFS